MAWLVRGGEVLASLEVATARRDRRRGLLGRSGVEGALLIDPARAIHTVGMRFPLDVAYCRRSGAGLLVLETASMRRGRIGRPRLAARCVLEAEAGAFERWRLVAGDELEIT
jgi:uncharacterized membrane protein (UPF0127 family)